MHYTIYQITNLVNGKVYIGAHKTKDLEDDYMGSGKILNRAIKKYDIANFTKEILAVFDTAEEMFNMESTLVNEDFVKRRDTYNIKEGGFGGWDYLNSAEYDNPTHSKDHFKMMTEKRQVKYPDGTFKNGIHSEKSKQLISENSKHIAGFKGKSHSAKTIEQMKESHKGKHVGTKNSQFGLMWITNGTVNKKIKKTESIPIGFNKGRTVKNK